MRFCSSDLSLAELQHLGQSLPLWGRQILLSLKLLLQLDGLVVGEPNLSSFSLVERPLDKRSPQKRFPCRGEDIRQDQDFKYSTHVSVCHKTKIKSNKIIKMSQTQSLDII